MVFYTGDPAFSGVMGCEDYQEHMTRYDLITNNICSLESKLSRRDLPKEKRKCYQFHLKGLKKKQEQLQRVIEV